MVGENGPQLDGFAVPPRPLRRCCGVDQATLHCGTCGHQIPPRPAPIVVEPVDDWPYNPIDTLGTN